METQRNNLYPIFLKAAQLNVLIVGGGNVGLEKLHFLLKSSPDANVIVVAPTLKKEIIELAENHTSVTLIKDTFDVYHLDEKHMVIAATDDQMVNLNIFLEAKKRNILVNLADQPQYCDFYLGGIVTKGNVKIAISTNGQSPTAAKRLRQFFEDVIPQKIDDFVKNLNEYRKTIKGDFEQKIERLNEVTKSLLEK